MKRITWMTLLGIAVGAIAGYMYYHYVGCYSGTCSITSKPMNSTMYGAIMGGLAFRAFTPNKSKADQNNDGVNDEVV